MATEIVLRKKHDGFGNRAKGDTYHAVFGREIEVADEAVGRAYRMLQRDHPSENPMAWEPLAAQEGDRDG